jgi:diguanylate cyclase (GGDEF)-like protein
MLPQFSRHSLRTQIALVFATLVILLSVLLSFVFGEMLKQRTERDAGAALFMVAENAGKMLAKGLLERAREAEVLALADAVWAKGLNSAEARHMLDRSQAMQPHNVWIGVADAQGTVRSATGDLLVGQSVADRAWFKGGLEKVFVGDVHPAKLLEKLLPPSPSGEPHRFVDFAAPIRQDNTVVGVLGIHGSWEWTRSVIESLTPSNDTGSAVELFIFDKQGQLIFAPKELAERMKLQGEKIPATLPAASAALATGAPPGKAKLPIAVVRWLDGHQYLTAASALRAQEPANDLGWTVVAREPVEQAFSEAQHTLRLVLAIGLGSALLASLLAWLAARRLSEDLYALATAARNVQADRLGSELPQAQSSREVRQLSGALTHMTQRLQAEHEVLEEKVRVRTLELQAANRALDLQARTDALTGLLNRRGFDPRFSFALALARRSGRPLSMIALDVDHFKRVNDSFGHDAGDEVLRRVARTLEARLRASDVIARTGGEEFVAMLPDTTLEGAQAIAHTLLAAMAEHEDAVVGTVTISAGVASLHGTEDQGPAMLRRADEALYEAKRQGRNRACLES